MSLRRVLWYGGDYLPEGELGRIRKTGRGGAVYDLMESLRGTEEAGGTLALYLDTLEFRQARCLLTMLRLSLTIERQAHHCVTSWWISLVIALWTTPHLS